MGRVRVVLALSPLCRAAAMAQAEQEQAVRDMADSPAVLEVAEAWLAGSIPGWVEAGSEVPVAGHWDHLDTSLFL